MAAILKTFAGLNFYTRTCFIDYYHISFKKSHQTLRPRSCRVNQNFDISWILDLGLRFVEFFSCSIDRIVHEHFLATVDFKLSYLVGPRTKFRVLALSVQNAN